MIEQVATRKNLQKAYRKVEKNQGSSGLDDMPVSQLKYQPNLLNRAPQYHLATYLGVKSRIFEQNQKKGLLKKVIS